MSSRNEKKFNKAMERAVEEEEINRILKRANLYDQNDNYNTRKDMARMLKESAAAAAAQQASACSMSKSKIVKSWKSVEESEIQNQPAKASTTTAHIVRKPQSDSEEEFQFTVGQKKTPLKQNESKMEQKATPKLPTREQTPRSTPSHTYAGKLLAASQKLNEREEKKEPVSPAELLCPSKVIDSDGTEELGISSPEGVGIIEVEKSVDQPAVKPTDGDDAIFPRLVVSESPPTPDRTSSPTPMAVSRVRMVGMRTKCRNHSAILQQARRLLPNDFTEHVDFEKKGAYQRLLDAEMNRKMAASQHAEEETPKWGKPISLSTLNGYRRRPLISSSPPPRRSSEESVDSVDFTRESRLASSVPKESSAPSTSKAWECPVDVMWNRVQDVDMTETVSIPDSFPDNRQNNLKTEKLPCPICGKLFLPSTIENHAADCSDYGVAAQDPVEPRLRPIRGNVTNTRATRSRLGQVDDDSRGSRLPLAATKSTRIVERDTDWDLVDSSSDFEAEGEELGSKRNNNKRDAGRGKKPRY